MIKIIITLTKQDVAGGAVNILIGWLSRVNHETINKLHGLCTLSTQLAGHHNFATLGARFHDVPKHTIASSEKTII